MWTNPFILYADAEIVYDGRAMSTLERGNYLIIHKPDLSLAVHGAKSTKPLNYQNAGTVMEALTAGSDFENIWLDYFEREPQFLLRAMNGKETILAAIYKIHFRNDIDNWTDSKIDLVKSERDLVNQIITNFDNYFPDMTPSLVDTEARTPYGNVDIMAIDADGTYHVIEVKRRVAGISACSQISRYACWFMDQGYAVKKYVSAPRLAGSANAYYVKNEVTFVPIDFDGVKQCRK